MMGDFALPSFFVCACVCVCECVFYVVYVCVFVCMYGIEKKKCNNSSGLHITLKLSVWRFMHFIPRVEWLCSSTLRIPHFESISPRGACLVE